MSYYVRRYKVRLGEEFISHMRDNDWQVKTNAQELEQEQPLVDGQPLW